MGTLSEDLTIFRLFLMIFGKKGNNRSANSFLNPFIPTSNFDIQPINLHLYIYSSQAFERDDVQISGY